MCSPNDPSSPNYRVRTDANSEGVANTPWFYFPYPGEKQYFLKQTRRLTTWRIVGEEGVETKMQLVSYLC